MQSRIKSLFFIVAALLNVIASNAASEADEKAVWNLWRMHLSPSNSHEAVIAAFQQTLQKAPGNSLLTVARGLCSWHLLQLSKTNEAVQMLEDMISAKPANTLNAAGAEIGRKWLTRIDREKVRYALRCYYHQQIAYPETLEALKQTPRIPAAPLTDRWNVRWLYRPTGFQTIKGLDNQRYLLQSAKLTDTSDLKIALARPYDGEIKIKPVSVEAASGVQTVRFEATDQKAGLILMSEGTTRENITLVYVGNKIIILSDGDYWIITPKPKL